MKNIAVIGAGYWGKNLIRIYNDLDVLKTICDLYISDEIKNKYTNIDKTDNILSILKDNDIDGVVISTPPETHYHIAKQCMMYNKNVYVEKPLTLNEEDAKDLIKLSEDKNVKLMVGHLLQYHPVFIKLKDLVNNGDLGKINYIYSNRLNFGKIRKEENILFSFAPHDISMILSLVDEEPENVSAISGTFLNKNVADITTTHLDFPSGVQASIFVSWLHPYKEQKLVVVGSEKMAVFDDTKEWKNKLLIYPHKIQWINNTPLPIKCEPERIDVTENEPLLLECKHFLNCIKTGITPLTDGKEGLRVLKVLNKAQRSIKSDKNRDYFVDDSSKIDQSCNVGDNTKIWNFSHIFKGCNIGSNCNIGRNVVIGPNVNIGNGCKIQNNVSVYEGVTLEDNVFCGPSMVFTNVYNPRSNINKMSQIRKTLVKEGATLGANCTIICGNTIGKYSFIGAGSVVNKDVPDHALMVGVPAKQVGWVCRCGETLINNECITCNEKYNLPKIK